MTINYDLLEQRLGCRVVPTSARDKIGLEDLLDAISNSKPQEYLDISYGVLDEPIKELMTTIKTEKYNPKWIALKILEDNTYYTQKLEKLGLEIPSYTVDVDVHLEVAIKLSFEAKQILKEVITYQKDSYDKTRKIDRILTSKICGIPIMLGILFICFYITIIGANYPSSWLFSFFSSLEEPLTNLSIFGFFIYEIL